VRADKRKVGTRTRAAVVAVAMEEVVEAVTETDGMVAVEVAAPGKDAEGVVVAAATVEAVIRQREEDLEEALEGAAVAADGREEVAQSLVLEQNPGKRS
jgi:hypothetical protein